MNELCAMWALIGMGSGVFVTGLMLTWLWKDEEPMACKAHGECIGCRLDAAEDSAREINAKQEPLWQVLNDLEPKMNIKHSQMREYVDHQMREQGRVISLLESRMSSLAAEIANLKK